MKTNAFDSGQCKRYRRSTEHGVHAATTCRRLLQTGGRILLLALLLLYIASSVQSTVIARENSVPDLGDRSPHPVVVDHERDPHASR